MKIALVGYGQMGHMIEQCAKKIGHQIVATIDPVASDATNKIPTGNAEALVKVVIDSGAEGIIEFSHPLAVMDNIKALLPLKLPLVVGTTGWKDYEAEVAKIAASTGGTIMRSANFSVGVNMFYRIVEEAAKLFASFDEYDTALWEAHHNLKADSPSGTALELAKRIMIANSSKTEMVFDAFHQRPQPHQLHVSSTRVGSVPGTHKVFFDSPADTIEITHTARSREGFAFGAVHALEKLTAAIANGSLKTGAIYGMEDLF